MRIRQGLLPGCITLLLLAAEPALAGKKTIPISPYTVDAGSGSYKARDSAGRAGLVLPDTDVPDFAFGFAIPKGYIKNSTIRVILNWRTPATGCAFELKPLFVDRSRPGGGPTTGGPTDGLTAEDGSDLLQAPATAFQTGLKVFSLDPAQGYTQQSGDTILLGFYRKAYDAQDTCTADLIVPAITVEYRVP